MTEKTQQLGTGQSTGESTGQSLVQSTGLKRVHAALASALGAPVCAQTKRELTVATGDVFPLDTAALADARTKPAIVVRLALEKEYAGHVLRVTFDPRTLPGSESIALQSFAASLVPAIQSALCATLGPAIGARLLDHEVHEPGAASSPLGDDPLLALGLRIKHASGAESEAAVMIPPECAERWNLRALQAAGSGDAGVTEEQEIPQAPVRAKLAAYTLDVDALAVLRKSSRRIGLELDRRARGDIPNPAAHKDQIVLIEVPTNEDRRFDWCKRLKNYSEAIKVVLLLHHPSRQRVLAGFMARADALIGWPVQEPMLSQKLGALVDAMIKSKDVPPPPDLTPAPAKS